MHLSIVEDSKVHLVNHTKCTETKTISPKSIGNFKNSINKANLITQFDLNPLVNPNNMYDKLAHEFSDAKNKHMLYHLIKVSISSANPLMFIHSL